MKSLEIVNRNIEEAQEALDEATDDFRIYPCDYGTWEEIEEHYTAPYLRHYIEENKQIKQDLEVLEIIRKKDVNLATLKLCIMTTDTIDQLLSKYNKSRYFTQDELTMEELLKLKQWLEENKNE